LLTALAPTAASGDGFSAPTVGEFFPGELLFVGTPFAMTRINLIGLFMTGVICLFFVSAFAKPKLVPRGVQNLGEMAVDLVQTNVIDEVMGEKGRKYAPYLVAMFWLLFSFNITGIIPTMHISASSVIAIPLMFALIAWLVFNIQGIRALGLFHYLKVNLFPPGIPWPIYILVTPIELVSTFILRPLTLTIRLLANMMAGHLLLVLFFSATSALLLADGILMKVFAIPAFFMGFAFTLFEILVAVLQAYIFTLLTAVYIDGATSEEH
jgi:F-type H+-transporting ATPase subunit a